MPIYEYQCESCGKNCEFLQKVTEAAKTDCPACGQPSLHKLVSPTGFQLKGSGWYVTDFRDKNKAKKTADAPPPSSPSETNKKSDSNNDA